MLLDINTAPRSLHSDATQPLPTFHIQLVSSLHTHATMCLGAASAPRQSHIVTQQLRTVR